MTVLDIENLNVRFGHSQRVAVTDLNLSLGAGERLGIIGESGSGKSVTALAVMGLLPPNAHVSGRVAVEGHDMVSASEKQRARLRGDVVSMVFQEPMTALDPTMRVGAQVTEARRLHRRSTGTREDVLEMLAAVGLPHPESLVRAFPHELSGGQRQRVLIAMALINSPALVICDEPTTALDVTVQAKVLTLLDKILAAKNAACLFISHDLAVVASMCQRIAVMRHGAIVEHGSTDDVIFHPQHPYTRGLVATAHIDDVPPGERLPVVEDFLTTEGPHG